MGWIIRREIQVLEGACELLELEICGEDESYLSGGQQLIFILESWTCFAVWTLTGPTSRRPSDCITSRSKAGIAMGNEVQPSRSLVLTAHVTLHSSQDHGLIDSGGRLQ